jgi:hypothetical protein
MEKETPNLIIKDYISNDGAQAWQHKDVARQLYWISDVNSRFLLAPRDETQPPIPRLVLAFPELQYNVLAACRLKENPLGLSYEISLNAKYLDRPLYELAESLLHEQIHLLQEFVPGYTRSSHGYHNQEYVSLAESAGLHPRLGSGAHWKPADGQFRRLMERLDIKPPDYSQDVVIPPSLPKVNWWDPDRGPRTGSSTLLKYICDCPPPGNSVRTGRRDLQAMCLACGTIFKADMIKRVEG